MLERLDKAGVVRVQVGDARRSVPEGNDRELRRAAEVLELGVPRYLRVQESRLAEVSLDRRANRFGPVRAGLQTDRKFIGALTEAQLREMLDRAGERR